MIPLLALRFGKEACHCLELDITLAPYLLRRSQYVSFCNFSNPASTGSIRMISDSSLALFLSSGTFAQAMELKTLPIDLFRVIFDGPNSVLALQLWKCGDRLLSHKLISGGVNGMDLKYRPFKNVSSRWPRMLKELKLSSLSITANPADSIIALRKEICSLHRGLKRLIIHNPVGALGTLFCALFQWIENPHENTRFVRSASPLDDPSAQNTNLCPQLLRLCDVFPNLEVLSVTSEQGQLELSSTHLQVLPRQLTSLKLSASLPKKCSDLPPNLTRLELLSSNELFLDSIVSGFPSSIQYIDAHLSNASFKFLLSDEGLKRFPNLDLIVGPRISSMAGEIADLASSEMWNRVHTLETAPFAHSSLFQDSSFVLPRNLTSLQLPAYSDLNIAAFPLPATLTNLEVNSLDWKVIQANPFLFPFGLRSLSLQDSPGGVRDFYLLPRKLEHLEWMKTDRLGAFLNDADSKFLGFIAQLTQKTDGKILNAMLEESIRRPSVTYSSENIRAIQQGYHFGLPLSLKSLKVYNYYGESSFVIPPHVTTASLQRGACEYPQFTLHHLPPSLANLSLPRNSKPGFPPFYTPSHQDTNANPETSTLATHTASTVSFPSQDESDPLTMLTLLPKGLRRLKLLDFVQTPRNVISCLETLPHGLISLNLGSASGFEYFPRWVKVLPKTLTKLNAPVSLEGADFAHLPPYLVSLSAGLYNVTSLHILSLPRTMRILRNTGKSISDRLPDQLLDQSQRMEELLFLRHLIPSDKALSAQNVEQLITNHCKRDKRAH